MSQTVPSLVPVLVDDAAEDVEVELPSDGPLVDVSAAEVSEPAGTVVISGWVMLPKLDAPPPPPQAVRALVSVTASEGRMGTMSLAKMPSDVTYRRLSMPAAVIEWAPADDAPEPSWL